MESGVIGIYGPILALELSDCMAFPIIFTYNLAYQFQPKSWGQASSKLLMHLTHDCQGIDPREYFYQKVYELSFERRNVEDRSVFVWNVFTR